MILEGKECHVLLPSDFLVSSIPFKSSTILESMYTFQGLFDISNYLSNTKSFIVEWVNSEVLINNILI